MPVVDTMLALAGRVSVEKVEEEVDRDVVNESLSDPEEDTVVEALRVVREAEAELNTSVGRHRMELLMSVTHEEVAEGPGPVEVVIVVV